MKDKYLEFLETKRKKVIESGFEVDESNLNINLFKFQKFVVKNVNYNRIIQIKKQKY